MGIDITAAVKKLSEETGAHIAEQMRITYVAGQCEMLKDARLGRIENWCDDSSNIGLADLRRMIRAVFADERARLDVD